MVVRVAAVALLAVGAWSAPAGGDLEKKIQRVESGLRRAVVVRGRPEAVMSLAERMKYYQVPGVSVAVISGGRLEWARGYGVTSATGGQPITVETVFQAASVSKPVAALVALRLVEQGKLALDEDVNQKLRSWKVPDSDPLKGEKVTLRRLLSHTAGLTVHGFRGYAEDESLPALTDVLDGRKPANSAPIRVDLRPGSKWRYSGGGYVVMQQLVMDAAGKPFPQVARELVLEPLGMAHSTYEQPLPARQAGHAAIGHGPDGAPIRGNWHTHPEMAAAGLWTTPSDLARVVVEVQAGGKVLNPRTVQEMLTRVLGEYGLGLAVGETDGKRWFSHGGSNVGFRCTLFAYRDTGRGAIVMTNGDRGAALADEILRGVAAEYGWTDYRPEEKIVARVDRQLLKSYAGVYRFPGDVVATVTFENGRLFVEFKNRPRREILPESPTSFFDAEGAGPPLRFVKKEDGSIELSAGGMTGRRR